MWESWLAVAQQVGFLLLCLPLIAVLMVGFYAVLRVGWWVTGIFETY